jgi:fibro-slime domain-containing protein
MRSKIESIKSISRSTSTGFVLPLTILLILGITGIIVGTLYNNHMGQVTAYNFKHKKQTFYAADGLVTLLTQEIISGRASAYIDTSKMGKVFGEVWTGLGGNSVASLKTAIKNGVPRSRRDTSTYLGSNWKFLNYGVRWSGWINPPFTGTYKIHLRSHMASEFYLNLNGSIPINYAASVLPPLCSLTEAEATALVGWPVTDGISLPILMEAGKFYYFEFFHKVGNTTGTDDMGQVGWEGPEWLKEFPIPRERLFEDTTAPPFGKIGLGVRLDSVSVRYQMSLSGAGKYAIAVEGIQQKIGNSSDTLFRAPLNQEISTRGTAAAPPDSVWLPVIYYDYRADGTNPEFQSTFNQMLPAPPPPLHPYMWNGFVVAGLVKPNQLHYAVPPEVPVSHLTHFGLSAIPKPIRNDANIKITCNLNKWFIPWVAGAPGNNLQPEYAGIPFANYTGAWPASPCDDGSNNTESICWKGNYCYYRPAGNGDCGSTPCFRYTANSCTSVPAPANNFENRVKLDSLLFLRQSNGSYRFSRSTSDGTGEFTPIDGFGFGNILWTDPNGFAGNHNYGFCMETHLPFVHASGLTFDFSGDDDVWVFINDSLVIDLGFVHVESSRTLNLDELPLTFGNVYSLDMFYCERTGPGSNILINTNIPRYNPKSRPVVNWKRNYGELD